MDRKIDVIDAFDGKKMVVIHDIIFKKKQYVKWNDVRNYLKKYLIKDTTKQERIELIRQWVPADEAMEDCEIDLWDMYHDYIEGKREIAEINAAFVDGE